MWCLPTTSAVRCRRWADEGAAVLSSDDLQRSQNERLLRQVLASPHRFIPLDLLVTLTDYPEDVQTLHAEGYSAVRFLVEAKDRGTFLAFLSTANRDGWDQAVQRHYGYPNLKALEKAWLDQARMQLAKDDVKAHVISQALLPREDNYADSLLAQAFARAAQQLRMRKSSGLPARAGGCWPRIASRS